VEEFYTVEPVKEHHRRKRRKRGSSTPVGRNWHVVRRIRSSLPHVMESRLHNSSAVLRWSREVRDRRDITVETAVFVDASLYNHMMRTQFQERTLEEMTHFVLAMINAVSKFLQSLLLLLHVLR